MKLTTLLSLSLMSIAITACTDKNMTKNDDGSYTVNTTELGNDIKGYAGLVPVAVTIKDSLILSVEILDNIETPEYLLDVEERLLPQYTHRPIETISEVDAVSGATYSSRAVIKNVSRAVEYYKKRR